MSAPIEDVSSLPGKKFTDQEQVPIGEIKDVYAMEDGFPMWVGIESGAGLGDKRIVFVPLARLKDEDGELRVPYSKSHILDAPGADADDQISEECDQALRSFYGIGIADQELYSDNKGYATLVSDETGAAERTDDVDSLETPDADKRTDETMERIKDPGSSEMRQVSAEDVAAESGSETKRSDGGEQKSEDGEPESDDGQQKSDEGEQKSDEGEQKSDEGERKSGEGG